MNRILVLLALVLCIGCSTTQKVVDHETFVQNSPGWVYLRDSSVNKLYFYTKDQGLPHASLDYYDKSSNAKPDKFMRRLFSELEGRISETDQQIFLNEVVDRVRIIQTVGK